MRRILEQTGLSALRRMDPEAAHGLALKALRMGLGPTGGHVTSPRLRTTFAGLDLPNPVGIAAGFDKNAVALQGLARSGLGFAEVGAVTPRAQEGNPRPRLFRLAEDRAVIAADIETAFAPFGQGDAVRIPSSVHVFSCRA